MAKMLWPKENWSPVRNCLAVSQEGGGGRSCRNAGKRTPVPRVLSKGNSVFIVFILPKEKFEKFSWDLHDFKCLWQGERF